MRVPAVLAVLLLTLSCNPADPPLPPPQPPPGYTPMIALSVVDSGLTDILLRVQIPDTVQERLVEIVRDGVQLHRLQLASPDSILRDDSLLINRAYQYRAYRMRDLVRIDSSQLIGVQTLDTTSHDFTWQTQVLGDGNSSVLYDVAIINDTLAYAVGEIYLRDSTGQFDPRAWNAMKWNGIHWELLRIPFIGPCSAVDYPPIVAIWAFSEDNVLVTNGGSIVRYDGSNAVMDCRMNQLLSGAITKMWGKTPEDVYVVGNTGSIVHYVNGTWRRVESGTGLPINDVFGSFDGSSWEIICVASNQFINQGRKLLRIQGDNVSEISTDGLPWALKGLWFKSGSTYYVAGDGLFHSPKSNNSWRRVPALPPYYKTAIHGSGVNDIVVVGAFGLVLHYNGSTWKDYLSQTYISSGGFGGVMIKNDLIIGVGAIDNRAYVLIGRR